MNNEQLSSIIEKLALEVVLIDHTEIDEMGDIVELFTQIVNWAEDNSQTILLHAASECAAIMTKLIAQSDPSPEESFSFITSAISEIQSHARNEFNFMAMVLPAIPGIKVPETEKSNVKTSPAPDKIGLRHPTTLPGHLDNELFAEFLALQTGNLDKMEALILSIEEQSDESSIIELKRMIHTIKGEAGFLNLGEIETLCHLTEDILGDKSPSQYTDIFLSTIDWMRKAFTWYSGGDSEPEPAAPLIEIIKSCHWDTNKKAPEDTKEEVRTDVNNIEKKISETLTNNLSELSHNTDFYSKFISRIENSIGSSEKFIDKLLPMIDNLQISDNRPSNELQQGILKLRYYITKITAVADFISLNEIMLLTKSTHNLLDKMLIDVKYCKPEIIALIKKSFNALKKETGCLASALSGNDKIKYDKNLPRLIAQLEASLSGVMTDNKNDAKAQVTGGKNLLVCENADKTDLFKYEKPETTTEKRPEPTQTESALTLSKEKKSTVQIKESINVDAERLDRIIDMIGELVIAESMVIQAEEIKNIDSQELTRHLNQMDKITRGLQETGLSLRMLPIKSTFQKMARIARDTAKKSGKDVKFIMQGEDTELDKTVVDKIGDPLLHMIRNAIDHGIEKTAEERTKTNKPEYGTVTIKAFHKGGNIHIVIEDDGRGLDKKSIISKAMERNLIQEGEILKDRDIYNLIFEPGFSTASEITDLSGRGVGMNVVKSSIEALHGQVEIKSEAGKGSMFTIKIPLTLAIIDGMVVRVRNERYIIPTLSIITSNKLDKNEITSIFKKGEMVDIQGQLVPLFLLSDLFKTTSSTDVSSQSLMVVVEEDDRQAAIVVDELLGKQQIVIKTLGESLKNIPGVSGGAIMPDGRVGLIIDVAGLVRLAHDTTGSPSNLNQLI